MGMPAHSDLRLFLMLELILSLMRILLVTRLPELRPLRLRRTHRLNSSPPSRPILIKFQRISHSESHSLRARETTTLESSAPRLPMVLWTIPQTFSPPPRPDLRRPLPSKTLL